MSARNRRKARARIATVPLGTDGVAGLVAQFATDPRCPHCAGAAELRPGPAGVAVVIDHTRGCPELTRPGNLTPAGTWPASTQKEIPRRECRR